MSVRGFASCQKMYWRPQNGPCSPNSLCKAHGSSYFCCLPAFYSPTRVRAMLDISKSLLSSLIDSHNVHRQWMIMLALWDQFMQSSLF